MSERKLCGKKSLGLGLKGVWKAGNEMNASKKGVREQTPCELRARHRAMREKREKEKEKNGRIRAQIHADTPHSH